MVMGKTYGPAGTRIKGTPTIQEILTPPFTLSRAGFRLEESQDLMFGFLTFTNVITPFPYFVPPLAPGASQYIINPATGLATGFDIPVGHYGDIIALIVKPSQDISSWIDFDGVMCGCLYWVGAGMTHYENEIIPLSSGMLDPLAAAAHNMNFFVTNEGAANLFGGCSVFMLLRRVGSEPLPDTKTIKCKWCDYTETVSLYTTKLVCPECGKTTLYFSAEAYRKK